MSSLASAVPNTNPSNYVEQASQNPGPQQAAQAQPAAPSSRLNTVLGAIVSATGSPKPAPVNPDNNTPPARPAWQTNLGKVASTVSTGLAGIPDKGRPSFVTGLGEGARSEQAIRFKTFDDQVRMAELHNQDLKMQNDTQAQTDAHAKAELDMRDFANEHGINYDTISNHGPSVMEHLAAQTQANGAASVPAGTHISADGKSIYTPQQNDQTKDGQKTMYNALAPALGLPAANGDFVPPKMMNMLTNKVNGFDIKGEPIKHEDLPGLLSATQTQRDNMAKNGASDAQLKTLDNMIGIYKANLNALDTHAAGVAGKNEQAKEQGKIAAQNSKEGRELAASNEKLKEQGQDNSAGNRNQGAAPTPDPFGVTSSLPAKEANSRYNTFSKSYVQPLTKTDQTNAQFQSILNDVNSGKDLTGAQSVVSLFDAIGISATPMKGQGFRLNKDVIQEHVQARGVDQSVAQKLGQLKSGEIITPQQIKDYAGIATQARESQYNSAIDEARRQGLPVDFLPKGNGAPLDASTARMYVRAAGGANNAAKAEAAAQQAGWRL